MFPANGLELSCPPARATVALFSRISAGKSRSNLPHASRVRCSGRLCENPKNANRVPT